MSKCEVWPPEHIRDELARVLNMIAEVVSCVL